MATVADLQAQDSQLDKDELAILRSLRRKLLPVIALMGEHKARILDARRRGAAPSQRSLDGYQARLAQFTEGVSKAMAFADLLSRIRFMNNLEDQGGEFSRGSSIIYKSLNEQLPEFLSLPFLEAVEDLASRDPVIERSAEAVSAAYKRHAFAMAYSTNITFTNLIQNQLTKTILEGGKLSDVIANFRKEGLADWYAETVFNTNIKTAAMAGRIQQSKDPDLQGFIVAWRYFAVKSRTTRENHRAMDGHMASMDNPVWNVWIPPNGYNCRCTLIEVTRPQAKKMGRYSNGTFEDDPAPSVLPDEGFRQSPAGNIYTG